MSGTEDPKGSGMRVTLIARTELTRAALPNYVTEEWLSVDLDATDPDDLAEFAGRACYQSFERPNPKTAANRDYLSHILEVQHYSVLSHASVTFYIEGVSRSLTHELVRHRFLAFSQLSQRYVDGGSAAYVEPPAVAAAGDTARKLIANAFNRALVDYESLVALLAEKGLTRKQAREAGRAVLPNATETRLVVSGNLRAWRDFLTQRLSPTADAEIRRLAVELLRQLREYAPATFQDFEVPDAV